MTVKTKLPRDHYARVSRSRPCPICEKPDWCLLARDGSHAICARVAVGGVFCGEPGWKHDLTNATPTTIPGHVREKAQFDASAYAIAFERAITTDQLADLSADLGVSVESLRRLRTGWCTEHDAPAFPMWQRGQICGIRIRTRDAKFCIRDSTNGFFLPRGVDGSEDLYIVEGPTDTAAGLDLGLDIIGKPNATACTDELLRYLLAKQPETVVFIGENDEPDRFGKRAGVDGPREQCRRAVAAGLNAVFILPLAGKDLREWKNVHGATRSIIEALVRNAA